MLSIKFAQKNFRWLLGGFVLTFSSTFGQTFFISLFSAEIRQTFSLSHGDFGLIYMFGTLASAATLVFAGKLTDHFRIATISVITLTALSLLALVMSQFQNAWVLVILVFGLRFLGQGMCGHIAMTSMGKWYNKQRGQAVSITALGVQFGEGIVPPLTVLLIASFGWRTTWQLVTVFLILIAVPITYFAMRVERSPHSEDQAIEQSQQRNYNRREVLADPFFYLVMLAMLAPAFMATSVFFHQIHLAEIKQWSRLIFPAHQFLLAISAVLSSLFFGRFVDKYNAIKLLPLLLVPLGSALIAIGIIDQTLAISIFMLLLGVTFGIASALFGSLCPELYGTKHLGSVRAMFMAAMVFSSALGPGLTGTLLDYNIGFETQLIFMACYCFVVAIAMIPVSRRMQTRL